MCGIAGIITRQDESSVGETLGSMVCALAHRGPDGRGVSIRRSGPWSIGLAHTRLAILDLSEAGAQPMQDSQGACCLTYNGEVYNFPDLKADLEAQGFTFASQTDTEVILNAYQRWSTAAISRLRGMFAFGLWDGPGNQLILARDPLGIKPLYYYSTPDTFVFASEVRALLASGVVPRRLDPEGVASYLHFGSVETPRTLVAGVQSLDPGCYLTVRPRDRGMSVEEACGSQPFTAPAPIPLTRRDDAVAVLREVLTDTVRRHLISDVPVALFLSGGIDSSVLAALMTREMREKPKTFHIGFKEHEYDEGRFAGMISKEYGTDHQDIVLTEQSLLEMLPDAIGAMDQPTMDGINSYVVSKQVAEAGYKVALSGLGADELFAGYSSFRRARLLRPMAILPPVLRRAACAVGGALLRDTVRHRKFWEFLESDCSPRAAYTISRQLYSPVEAEALYKAPPPAREACLEEHPDAVNAISIMEMRGYMADTLLRDTDFMSMAHALEVRVPFVDAALVQYVLELPGQWKIGGRPKPLLLDAVAELLPQGVWQRPKMGFTLPFKRWMLSELRPQLDRAFGAAEDGLRTLGIDPDRAGEVWEAFQANPSGERWTRPWALFVLGEWCALHGVRP
ncbi:MAG TPA: asparagine synthase (glutamine-hydrolyzing) [Bryobacteraceae bacterium]|nr:asparagine synthase (glutamine-hydrolyzing) [Bryobacteraceae bacterium]